MAASVSSSPVAMCISFHEGHFCDAGKGGLEVSSNSPPQPRSFIHRLEIIECSFLPTGNMAVSFGTKHVLWACLHAFFFILSAQWNVHGWASQSLQPNQESPKKPLEDWGRGKHLRGYFSTAPMQKCPLLLAMMMVRRRKAGGWSYSLPGTLSGSWGAWGEQQKVGHFVPPTQVLPRWFIAAALASGSALSLPGLLHFQHHLPLNSTNGDIPNNCGASGFGFIGCPCAYRTRLRGGLHHLPQKYR